MPRVSIILPIYRSQATLAACLAALNRQTYRDFEIVAVDSSPDEACAAIVQLSPNITYLRSRERLLPHAAANRALLVAGGELLAFTDPDSYAHADWLEQLVRGHREGERVCVGAVDCVGRRWLDLGAHLCKFDKWLPTGRPRRLQEGPTVNLLVSRKLLDRAGGRFHSDLHGDTDLCWRLAGMGVKIWSVPGAVVEHQHLHTWRSLLAERWARGAGVADLRLSWKPIGPAALCLRLMVTILPLRLASQLWRVGRNAGRAGKWWIYLRTLPVVCSGLYSGLLGEAQTMLGHLLRLAGRPDG